MIATAPVDAVMQALAVPTRRAVFERIVRAGELTVVELTGAAASPRVQSPSASRH